MRKRSIPFLALILSLVLAVSAGAAGNTEVSQVGDPVCVDGVCYPSEEAARAAGAIIIPVAKDSKEVASQGRRLAMGYMPASELIAFIRNEAPPEGLEDHALWLVLLLVLLGGLAANLTPCVLPLVPINLMLIGRGWRRGAAYAAGITTAYGVLGLAAAFGGLAFGTLQSSPWFNGGVTVVFIVLALAMLDVIHLPQIGKAVKGLRGSKDDVGGNTNSDNGRAFKGLKAYMLGFGAATLAGACVEPILIATLLLTAKWFAAGRVWAVILPFELGAGIGHLYPFAAAGLSVLPRPGAWMVWVKRGFACVFFAMAAWYGWQVVGRMENAKMKMENEISGTENDMRQTSTKPVFIKIGAPWCRNCASMARTTFRDPDVVRELSAFDVREIEIDSFADLAKYPEISGLDIKGLPAYVVIEKETAKENK